MRHLSGVDSSGSHEEATGECLGQSTEGPVVHWERPLRGRPPAPCTPPGAEHLATGYQLWPLNRRYSPTQAPSRS